jgi:hypothetical protein
LEKFEKELKDMNTTIYIFYDLFKESKQDDCDIQKIAIYLIIVKLSFPPEYKNYGNIFSSKEYMEIAENP